MTTLPTCSNPVRHMPRVHLAEKHHHPPTAWRKLMTDTDQSWWRTVPLCGNCHDGQYHQLLDHHVRAGDVPAASVTRTYSRYVRALVAEAWANKPPGKPPYTMERHD